MKRVVLLAATALLVAPLATAKPAAAGTAFERYGPLALFGIFAGPHPQSKTYRGQRRPVVRGYRREVGGYSFDLEDILPNPPVHKQPDDFGVFFDGYRSSVDAPVTSSPYP